MMYKNKSSLWLTLGAAALLIAGGVATYYFVLSRKALENVPIGANIVPTDAMMAVSFSTEPKQWEKLREYGTTESKAALNKTIQDWRDRLFTDSGFNYQEDIQPWIGDEVMVAWLPHQTITSGTLPKPDSPPSSPTEPAMVIVFPIANPQKAQEVLAQPKLLTEGEISERTYRGIEIIETQGLPTQNYSIAVLGEKFLLVTTDANATDRTIDTFRGEASIAKTPGYANAVEKVQTSRSFAEVYLNIPVAASVASFTSAQPIPPENLEKLQQHQGFVSSVVLESGGINFKGISWYKPSSQKTLTVENQSQEMLERIPDNAMMVMVGGNLQRLWQDYSQDAASNPIAPFNPEALSSSLKQATQMDLEKDFLSWMDGEFSLALIPAIPNKQTPQKFSAGLALMVETRDRKAAETALEKLDAAMKSKDFQIQPAQLQGQPVVKWTSPYGGFSVIRGWLEEDVLFATLGAPIANQILPEPENTIPSDSLFRETVPTELSPNNGSFFVDVEQVFDRRNLSLPQLPPAQAVWVNAIQSIGVTAAVVSDRSTRYDIFVNIKENSLPSVTPSPEETPAAETQEGSP
ncbi:DUF3352 domain-containing protein [Lyngbya sp. PCC 8106]|uniref:DUF3352 domain-containing protein n=1 Tax=Lyngbya sp. (strain PCC 8106) TaxID=313612 RepID=UPI0009FF3BB1|nr:DUF3352 domain-containing protein [Lyngbya sp. PCC 8106]